jgi:APA family basic amino acid/polyamine antiporter
VGGERGDRGRRVLYVEHFINKGQNKLVTVLLVLVGLWLPAAVNLSGVKNMGSVQISPR